MAILVNTLSEVIFWGGHKLRGRGAFSRGTILCHSFRGSFLLEDSPETQGKRKTDPVGKNHG